MFRVIALGYWGGLIVDQLRGFLDYYDIRFIYCNSNETELNAVGKASDEHILLNGIAQCRETIHDDNELMAILVADLYEECGQKYAVEIMWELWDYADHTYCLAAVPFAADGLRKKSLDILKLLIEKSDITVVQDNAQYKAELLMRHPFMGAGMMLFLDLLLSHPEDQKASEYPTLPYGVETDKSNVLKTLKALYSKDPKMKDYYDCDLFSFLTEEYDQ